MAKSPFQRAKTPYETLRDEWYEKLAASGFEDIEQDEDQFKASALSRITPSKRDPRIYRLHWESIETYYQMARRFNNDHEFANRFEANVWMYHSEGVSTRDIANIMKKFKQRYRMKRNVGRNVILEIIARLKTIMFQTYMSNE
jgi:hypothetical protein